MGFTYNGIHSDEMGLTVRSNPSILAPIENDMQGVPGRPGAYYRKSKRKPRPITKEIGFIANDFRDYHQRLENLAAWLMPGDEAAPLVDDDRPGKTYYVVLDGSTDLDRIARVGKGTILFVAPNPDGEGGEINQTINDPSDPANANSIIQYNGTAETKPKFTATFNKPVTHFEISNQDNLTLQGSPKTIVLGEPAAMEQTEVDREVLVMDDTMQSTSGWQTAAEVDHGYVAGEMGADSRGFFANLFGAAISPYSWQGPSLIRDIGASLQDFRADIYLRQFNVGHETGMIEVYFRDMNNNVVCKIGFEDPWKSITRNQGKAQIGDMVNGHDIYTKSDSPAGWNDFDGIMRIQRIGNVWHPYFAIIQNGRHVWRRSTLYYTDVSNQWMTPITQVQVAIRKWPSTDVTDMAVHHIKIYEINEPQTIDEIPYIVAAGDVIEIDAGASSITKNGEPYMQITDLESIFFALKQGENRLSVSPADAASVVAKYKERFL